MENRVELTPNTIFEEFRKAQTDIAVGRKALENFKALENKLAFLEPTLQFLEHEERDRVRSWGTNLLEMIGGEKAFRWLTGLFNQTDTQEIKRTYLFTRFFALRAIAHLANSDKDRHKVHTLLKKIWPDDEEDYLVRAEAAILLAQTGQSQPEEWLSQMLHMKDDYWPIKWTLRALREFPRPNLADEIIWVIQNSVYLEHKYSAIEVLGAYAGNLNVIRVLGDVILTDRNEYLRLAAVMTLAQIGETQSQEDLVHALQDENAEVRFQAAKALLSFLSPEAAASSIVQQALKPGVTDQALKHLIEALRIVNPDRTVSTEILSKELGGEDRKRAELAESILIDLGGWAAVQKLSQRRRTLDSLDKLLVESEKAVNSTFEGTIRQARLNFYFAMALNVMIVLIGLTLVILAIRQLIQQPEKLEAWLVPGGAGVIGTLINLGFNNPRSNAREDLATLIKVNVIFFGFLHRLNEIDATFKYAYLESPDFGTGQMGKTVQQIEDAVIQTLNAITHHLRGFQQPKGVKEGREASQDQNK